MPALLDVFYRATEDLDERRGRALHPRNPKPLDELFRHLIATDPDGAVVADDRGRIVAFGLAMTREQHWYLSFLFVVPDRQGKGLGRAVLDECLRDAAPIRSRATCAEADQPVSTGLYAALGLAPRLPIYVLRGALDAQDLPQLPDGARARSLSESVAADLDARLVGHRRPQEHRFWAGYERRGWAFETRAGEPLGYGYAHRSGRLGPVAAIDPGLLMPFVGHLVRSVNVLEGWQLVVPGPALEALSGLLRVGLRIDQTPAIYCSDAAMPSFERYLPASFALL